MKKYMLYTLLYCCGSVQAQTQVIETQKIKAPVKAPVVPAKTGVTPPTSPKQSPVITNNSVNRNSTAITAATRIKDTLFKLLSFAEKNYSEEEKIEIKKLVEELNTKIIQDEKEEEQLLQRLEKVNGLVMGKKPLAEIKTLASDGILTQKVELQPYDVIINLKGTEAYESSIPAAKKNALILLKNAKEYDVIQKSTIEKALNMLSENFEKATSLEEKRIAGHKALSAANDVWLSVSKQEPFDTIEKLLPKEKLWSKIKNFFSPQEK
jgi:hypothetical protein